jgi:hypothetical protein
MAMENLFEIPYLVYLKITLKYEYLHVIEINNFFHLWFQMMMLWGI